MTFAGTTANGQDAPTADLPTVPAAAFTVSGTKHMPSEIAGPADREDRPSNNESAVSGGINEKYRPKQWTSETYNRAVEQT
jgi:hypothetical protein